MVFDLTSKYRRRERGMEAMQRFLPASDLGVGLSRYVADLTAYEHEL